MSKKAAEAISDWPADSVERRAINDLLPYAGNPRAHPDWQIAQISESMKEWGWTIPILIDEGGNVIAGHGRIFAALRNGYADAPCMIARGWDEEKKRAYVVADNKLALNSSWDPELLKMELSEIVTGRYTAGMMGFSEDELNTMLHGWNYEAHEKDVSFTADADSVTLKIKCPVADREPVIEAIRQGLDGAGFSQLEIG